MAPQTAVSRSTQEKPVLGEQRGSIAWAPRSNLDRPEWISIGRRLGRIGRCNQWWLGDWLRYGSAKWGEKYSAAARITGYDARSLANIASLASAFPLSRRRDNLTWSHHAAVAGLPAEEQDSWLDRAESERLSVADLRVELRGLQTPGGDSLDGGGEPVEESEQLVCPRCGFRMEAREEG